MNQDQRPHKAPAEPWWEDHDNRVIVAQHGPVEVYTVPWFGGSLETGLESGAYHRAWVDYEDLDREARELRELAAHCLAAADTLDRINRDTHPQ